MTKYSSILSFLNIKKWISYFSSEENNQDKYFVACFYLKNDIIADLSYLKLESELRDLLKDIDVSVKQEAYTYHEDDVKKIRRVNIKEKPISSILEKTTSFEKIGIYLSNENWKWIDEPDLIVNLHISKESMVKNEKLYGFFIIGINKSLSFDIEHTLAKIKSIYKSIDGIGGGNFNNQEYVFKRTKSTKKEYDSFDSTSIKWAFNNFSHHVQEDGINNWQPGFDNKW